MNFNFKEITKSKKAGKYPPESIRVLDKMIYMGKDTPMKRGTFVKIFTDSENNAVKFVPTHEGNLVTKYSSYKAVSCQNIGKVIAKGVYLPVTNDDGEFIYKLSDNSVKINIFRE